MVILAARFRRLMVPLNAHSLTSVCLPALLHSSLQTRPSDVPVISLFSSHWRHLKFFSASLQGPIDRNHLFFNRWYILKTFQNVFKSETFLPLPLKSPYLHLMCLISFRIGGRTCWGLVTPGCELPPLVPKFRLIQFGFTDLTFLQSRHPK